ncbi:MAG: ArsR family transcriptional regulator [Phycisphaerales bacterium]|nr:ArsR family transcriptional regulator [Phycisphaerales bacterium]
MASIYKHAPSTPRQAARRKARLDQVLCPDLLKALAEPTRARLLSCLLKCGRPCSVTEVAECCSIDFSVVARHLSTMARAGLLNFEKRGRVAWYTARREELAAHFRALADAIDELEPADTCCSTDTCACPPQAGSSR